MARTGSDSTDDRGFVAVIGALNRELHPLIHRFDSLRRLSRSAPALWTGSIGSRRILLARTGPGADRARRAAGRILSSFPVESMISFGFACGLSPDMRIGDLVLAERTVTAGSERKGDPEKKFESTPRLLKQAAGVAATEWDLAAPATPGSQPGARFFQGSLLSVRRIAENPAEKRALAERTGAVAIDMESAWLAEEADRTGTPYLAVKAVSDLLEEDLTGISRFLDLEHGRGWFSALGFLAAHPGYVKVLNRLRIQTAFAASRIGPFVFALLSRMADGNEKDAAT